VLIRNTEHPPACTLCRVNFTSKYTAFTQCSHINVYFVCSNVNKDLTLKAKATDSPFKAKAKAKDRTFEGLNRELDI